jgi:N-acyl homoserine lactone hydrolase
VTAPILAYLIETANGRILYDVGCDYRKIADPVQRSRYYDPNVFAFGAPDMNEEQRLRAHLARMGLTQADVDVVFLGHLHFDHAGGLCDVAQCEIHVQADEFNAAHSGEDLAYFREDFTGQYNFKLKSGEYEIATGVRAIATPGHTAGHMSMWIELSHGAPVLLCGDAADLYENLDDEIAPGICWHEQTELAVNSIKKLKTLARTESATLWPNHDMDFYQKVMAQHAWHM